MQATHANTYKLRGSRIQYSLVGTQATELELHSRIFASDRVLKFVRSQIYFRFRTFSSVDKNI